MHAEINLQERQCMKLLLSVITHWVHTNARFWNHSWSSVHCGLIYIKGLPALTTVHCTCRYRGLTNLKLTSLYSLRLHHC